MCVYGFVWRNVILHNGNIEIICLNRILYMCDDGKRENSNIYICEQHIICLKGNGYGKILGCKEMIYEAKYYKEISIQHFFLITTFT